MTTEQMIQIVRTQRAQAKLIGPNGAAYADPDQLQGALERRDARNCHLQWVEHRTLPAEDMADRIRAL